MTDQGMPPRPRSVRANSKNLAEAVTVADTPSGEIIAAGKKAPVQTTDATGRSLKVKYLTLLDQMRIARVLGGELAKNDQYKALASLSFCVVEIDGEAVAPPINVREVEFLCDRLGEDGAVAIGQVYVKQGWSQSVPALDLDEAKN
jgi:hypothetical protein